MATLKIVVDKLADWAPYYHSENIISVNDYLEREAETAEKTLVINLCHGYKYLSSGYYCSLLAEARNHTAIPSIKTISELSNKQIYSIDFEDINGKMSELKKSKHHRFVELGGSDLFRFKIYFGKAKFDFLQEVARNIFDYYPCPILSVTLSSAPDSEERPKWKIRNVRIEAFQDLNDEDQSFFAEAIDQFSRKMWRKPRLQRKYKWDLAILHNPADAFSPSNMRALKKFIQIGKEENVRVDLIEKDDLPIVGEYDALFIRETTAVNNHTYRFAKKAQSNGVVVMDDPQSILRCTNKVYLESLFKNNGIRTPKSIILNKDYPQRLSSLKEQLGLPLVLKIPDGSFSRGVVRIEREEELQQRTQALFKESSLLIAQEYLYTDYDWRVGVLNGRAIFCCKYFMSRGHWQVYNHQSGSERHSSGSFEAFPIGKAPRKLIQTALKAANLIGNGLYGVDVKEKEGLFYVIEVNDNPNIDAGVEDAVLGDDLYRIVMAEFIRRIQLRGE